MQKRLRLSTLRYYDERAAWLNAVQMVRNGLLTLLAPLLSGSSRLSSSTLHQAAALPFSYGRR